MTKQPELAVDDLRRRVPEVEPLPPMSHAEREGAGTLRANECPSSDTAAGVRLRIAWNRSPFSNARQRGGIPS